VGGEHISIPSRSHATIFSEFRTYLGECVFLDQEEMKETAKEPKGTKSPDRGKTLDA